MKKSLPIAIIFLAAAMLACLLLLYKPQESTHPTAEGSASMPLASLPPTPNTTHSSTAVTSPPISHAPSPTPTPTPEPTPSPSPGWLESGGQRYYIGEDGEPLTGWHIINGDAQFFTPEWVEYRLSVVSIKQLVPEGFVPPELVSIESVRTVDNYLLGSWAKQANREAAVALDTMMAAAQNDGINGFFINSAYRSQETQRGLYVRDNGKEPDYSLPDEPLLSLPPRASEHEGGLTFDIMTTSMRKVSTAITDTPQGKWLHSHAHEYGFIIRYTEGKQHITYVQPEPWHFRYVGVDAAAEIYASGQCLEEYLGLD